MEIKAFPDMNLKVKFTLQSFSKDMILDSWLNIEDFHHSIKILKCQQNLYGMI